MKKLDLYSEKNLESFAKDLLCYLHSVKSYRADSIYGIPGERLSTDVIVYTTNKRYVVDEENFTCTYRRVPIRVEENVNVEDWVEYCNKKTLTFTMDSILCEYLYYGDVPNADIVRDRIYKIFEKHGYFVEFGNSTTVFAWTKDDYPR